MLDVISSNQLQFLSVSNEAQTLFPEFQKNQLVKIVLMLVSNASHGHVSNRDTNRSKHDRLFFFLTFASMFKIL